MGGQRALRLLNAGYPMLVYNRAAAKVKPLIVEEAQAADSVGRVSREAEVLFAVLSYGHGGLIGVDFATVDKETS